VSKNKSKFPHFDDYVCDGDMVQFYEPKTGLTFRARIVHDDDCSQPDERSDGFWPSLDPKSAGYLGEGKNNRHLAYAQGKAQAIMDAWRNDEWWYVGVCVTVGKADVQLTGDYANALWGCEANYPTKRSVKHRNRYLREVANDLIDEARKDALAAIRRINA
jgi:hypothetical protein